MSKKVLAHEYSDSGGITLVSARSLDHGFGGTKLDVQGGWIQTYTVCFNPCSCSTSVVCVATAALITLLLLHVTVTLSMYVTIPALVTLPLLCAIIVMLLLLYVTTPA